MRAVTLLSLAVLGAAIPAASAAEPFNLETYFRGRTQAQGRFESWIAGVKRDMTVTLNGRWDGRTLTLVEDFVFDDGTRDRKTWRFEKLAEGRYAGRREDVVGTAEVEAKDGRILMRYEADLVGKDGSKTRVHFDDVLEPLGGGRVRNTARVTKFGLPVATVDLTFSKPARTARR